MKTLPTPLRNQLGRTIVAARREAETGARKALESLAVERHEPHGSMSIDERTLRNRLRARGRQLGDRRDKERGSQPIDRLTHEVAYEHWHRMLFARFLAENHLLIHPEHGVSVSLDEIEELAREAGEDPRSMAARFAQDSLPQIFRSGDPVLEVTLAPETRQALDRLLDGLPTAVFTADDSLGWTYQYWQTEKKDAVNASGNKIGADELPAVTQLFTEHYMVLFLYHNTIGAWHAGKVLAKNPSLAETAQSEEELRRAVRLRSQGGYDFEYLRFVRTSPLNPLSMNGEGTFGAEGEGTFGAEGEGTFGAEGGGASKADPVTSRNHVTPEKLEMARRFRKVPTAKEAETWQWLRDRRMSGLKWRRQQVIAGFIADFYCAEHHLALEIDGESHDSERARTYDEVRDAVFLDKGIRTIRIRTQDCTRENLLRLIEDSTTASPERSIDSPASSSGPYQGTPSSSRPYQGTPSSSRPYQGTPSSSRPYQGTPSSSRPYQGTPSSSPSPFMERGPGGEVWRPAAGTFEGWPKTAKELKILDPCCGSGHFLTEGFELLVRLRMDEEGLELEDAIRGVLSDNLHGLELDPRCTQIAAFNLAMAAWKLVGKPIELPPMHIACSGLAPNASKDEWLALAEEAAAEGDMPPKHDLYGVDESLLSTRLKEDLAALYDLFEQAPILGSLIDPRANKGDLFQGDFAALQPLLAAALESERADTEQAERVFAAKGMARAANLLAGEYTLAITNVPYLGRGQQNDLLKGFADEHYKEARADLATIFLARMLRWHSKGGTVATVTPQTWLFLTSYRKFRRKLLSERTWRVYAQLGANAFRVMNYWAATTALVVLDAASPDEETRFMGLDAGGSKSRDFKRYALRGVGEPGREAPTSQAHARAVGEICVLAQADQMATPDSRVTLSPPPKIDLLSDRAHGVHGLGSKDSPCFFRQFWEIRDFNTSWELMQTSVKSKQWFGGMEKVVFWEDGQGLLQDRGSRGEAILAGGMAWGKLGVLVNQMGQSLSCCLYVGDLFEKNVAVLLPRDASELPAIWAFASSPEYRNEIRKIDQKVYVTNLTLVKVPFDLEHWQNVATEKYRNGLPEPQSDDPTQWLFHGHPAKAEPATVLQVAFGRLLGYRWPPEIDPDMRLADEAREWVARCDELLPFADEDGIVCLSATRGERSAADRLRELLSAAFGSDWSASKERELLAVAGDGKKPSASLDIWLRDCFFEEHCRLFHHRPFVWHIWDGDKDGFHCLVNAHKLTGPDGEGRRTMEAITYSYLGDWIDRRKADQRDGKEGAEARLIAAQDLQGQLEKILEGEPPYDLFVRWKPLHQQAIGWAPDINDGVRLNARPFMKAELRKGGKKGAGIYRWKPNIKWKKDRGKEPQSLRPKADFPWFWTCPGNGTSEERTDFEGGAVFDGNRWNDLHYSNASKRVARERIRSGETP